MILSKLQERCVQKIVLVHVDGLKDLEMLSGRSFPEPSFNAV